MKYKHQYKWTKWWALLFTCLFYTAHAQRNITQVEYYVDNDAGYGKATQVPIIPAQNLYNVSFTYNFNSLSPGLHVIGVRSKDANGTWSFDERWLFLKTASSASASNIARIEYYLDKDPGYGSARLFQTFTQSQDVSNATSGMINIDTLSTGLHILGVRSRNANGQWSLDERWLFLKPATTASLTSITRIEYYLDKDPGYGNARLFTTFTHLENISNASSGMLNIDTLSPGMHIIGVRSRNANGQWSFDERWLFLKPDTVPSLPNIVRVEYYSDEDPGYGKGTPVSITPGTNLVDLPFEASISETGLEGLHKVCVRSQDAKGAWSFDQCWLYSGKALPVNFIQFTATGEKDKVRLLWSTALELNSKEFLVRRSLDGLNYETIGTVPAAGNSTSVRDYYYDDYNAMQLEGKKVYYQLLQKDLDGQGRYTDIKIVTIKKTFNSLQLAYNPVKSEALLKYKASGNNAVIIRIIDAAGKTIKVSKVQVQVGLNQIPLNVAGLAKGIYEVEVISNKDSRHVRMMKN